MCELARHVNPFLTEITLESVYLSEPNVATNKFRLTGDLLIHFSIITQPM